VHGAAAPHAPVESHVCTPLPEHCVAPGEHAPAHAPLTHAWLAHGVGVPHVPVVPQTSRPSVEHCVAAGWQTPAPPAPSLTETVGASFGASVPGTVGASVVVASFGPSGSAPGPPSMLALATP
jgi:hypothetical protein